VLESDEDPSDWTLHNVLRSMRTVTPGADWGYAAANENRDDPL